jgi:alkyl hydroperoxide reductase subunit AhpC
VTDLQDGASPGGEAERKAWEKVESYVKERKLTYTIAVDTKSHMIRSFGVLATPTHIIIDRSGMVRYIAASIPGDIEKHMDELLR